MSTPSRRIIPDENTLIDGISLPLKAVGGCLRVPLRIEEEVFLEVDEDSIEADCLRSGLADKLGKRVVLLMTGDPKVPFRIAVKTSREAEL